MPSKLKKAIGAVKDQTSISLAKVSSNSSSNLEVVVLKATTHDVVAIDDKYINEILRLVTSNKANAAACARAIGKRIGRTRNWVVALKSLMLVLRVFQDGDPYFPREVLHAMKRGAKILNLSSFRDDSNSSPWDFTAFVRTFALYLDERLECFLTGKLQRRYTHVEKEGSIYQQSRSRGSRRSTEPVRDMKPSMLLDKISYWQILLERAIATRPTGAAKTNRLVQISLYAIVQESFDLYKDISDGLTLLLDSFFHLQYQNCVTAFQTCIKAVKQFEELSSFYTLCKSINVGRSSEYPSVQTISQELIETLQEFLKDQTASSSNGRSGARLMLPSSQSPVRSMRHESSGGLSQFSTTAAHGHSGRSIEFGSQCTSLEELISATETRKNPPSISIDLETYSASQADDAFRISDTGSTRSLPVSNSMADLMSIGDWSEQQKDHEQLQEQKLTGPLDSSTSNNWELELAETVTNSNKNSFNASPEQALPIEEPTDSSTATTGWELALFEAVPKQPPEVQQPIVPNNHYNPFLQDLSNVETTSPTPTFQAIPTFSAHDSDQTSFAAQNENDPFACGVVFSGEKVLSSSVNQHNLMKERELWLRNQDKIIAKHNIV